MRYRNLRLTLTLTLNPTHPLTLAYVSRDYFEIGQGPPQAFQRINFGIASAIFSTGWMTFLSPDQQCQSSEKIHSTTVKEANTY